MHPSFESGAGKCDTVQCISGRYTYLKAAVFSCCMESVK